MTLAPFKGRCHTCGHDHDADAEQFAQLMHDMREPERAELRRLAAEVERLTALVKEAYTEGFYSTVTYNDGLLNSADEAWPKSHAAAAMKEQP